MTNEVAAIHTPNTRSFYSGTVERFLSDSIDEIIGKLSSRHVAYHAAAEAEQIRAWEAEIDLLKNAFRLPWEYSSAWSILLEVPLFRVGKRLDAVILAPGVIGVIEFKIGAKGYLLADSAQVERYALSLKDFHHESQSRIVIPVLCAEYAQSAPLSLSVRDGTAALLKCNATTLANALQLMREASNSDAPKLDATGFDLSPYRPTPTIVEAAQALYAGHTIADIGRGDAADAELQAAAEALRAFAAEAKKRRKRLVCFVTGAPGAGKTLLGLDLALRGQSSSHPAALLSGNRPLVHVLTEALAADNSRRTGQSKADAKYQADASIQNLLGYLREHTDGGKPPEHMIVFDEAQRAWNAEVGQELMGRPKSEPALFLEILSRLDWTCLVCLVGPGQEINRGEGGLPLWASAILDAARSGVDWEVIAAPEAIEGGVSVAGEGLASVAEFASLALRKDPRLHLANAIRSYRNPLHGLWVSALLESDIDSARALSARMNAPPAFLTRDLATARSWLRQRRTGGRSVGLLCSSGAVRLVGEGLPYAPRSNELGPIGHWFLKPYTDFRSASALETPMSEFGCQGLEVDYAGLCWGGDLIWDQVAWQPRMMRAPKWQIVRDSEKHRFRLNAYRVLLTRARAGLAIFVPTGSDDDNTRSPREFDDIAQALTDAGCGLISDS
jgi:hypothetical protein